MNVEQTQLLVDVIKRIRGDRYDDKESVFYNLGALEIGVFHLQTPVESLKAMIK